MKSWFMRVNGTDMSQYCIYILGCIPEAHRTSKSTSTRHVDCCCEAFLDNCSLNRNNYIARVEYVYLLTSCSCCHLSLVTMDGGSTRGPNKSVMVSYNELNKIVKLSPDADIQILKEQCLQLLNLGQTSNWI